MTVRVRTQQELDKIQEENLIPEGVYGFTVKTASDELSKSGNDMVKLLLEIDTKNGKRGVYDYLVDIDSMAFKIKHFCETTGMNANYFSAVECLGHQGKVDIRIDKASNGYPAKNKVADYVVDDKNKNPVDYQKNSNVPGEFFGESSHKKEYFNDDIPF